MGRTTPAGIKIFLWGQAPVWYIRSPNNTQRAAQWSGWENVSSRWDCPRPWALTLQTDGPGSSPVTEHPASPHASGGQQKPTDKAPNTPGLPSPQPVYGCDYTLLIPSCHSNYRRPRHTVGQGPGTPSLPLRPFIPSVSCSNPQSPALSFLQRHAHPHPTGSNTTQFCTHTKQSPLLAQSHPLISFSADTLRPVACRPSLPSPACSSILSPPNHQKSPKPSALPNPVNNYLLQKPLSPPWSTPAPAALLSVSPPTWPVHPHMPAGPACCTLSSVSMAPRSPVPLLTLPPGRGGAHPALGL